MKPKAKVSTQSKKRSASKRGVIKNEARQTAVGEVKVSTPAVVVRPHGAINEAIGRVVGAGGDFAHEIGAAWTLVEAGCVGAQRAVFQFRCGRRQNGIFYAAFYADQDSEAESAPLAICKAFMKFKGIAA